MHTALAGAVLVAALCQPGQREVDLTHSPLLYLLAKAQPARWLPLQAAAVHSDEVTAPAVAALKSPSAALRARAAFVLGEAGCSGGVEALAATLRDPDRTVRLHAGVALCRLCDPRGLPAAVAALHGARPWLRYYALVGLWRLGSEPARRAVEAARSDPDPLVAYAATAAAGTWRGRPTPFRLPQSLPPVPPVGPDVVEWTVNALIAESDWWWHRGKHEQSIRCNEAVVFLAPDAEDMYTNSAWLLWSMGRHAEAIGTYHRCIAANPTSGHGPFYLGFYYMQHGDLVAAEKYLALAVRNAPDDHLARRTYAHCLENQGRLADALAQWEILRRQRPTDGSVLLNIRRLHKKMAMQPDP